MPVIVYILMTTKELCIPARSLTICRMSPSDVRSNHRGSRRSAPNLARSSIPHLPRHPPIFCEIRRNQMRNNPQPRIARDCRIWPCCNALRQNRHRVSPDSLRKFGDLISFQENPPPMRNSRLRSISAAPVTQVATRLLQCPSTPPRSSAWSALFTNQTQVAPLNHPPAYAQ